MWLLQVNNAVVTHLTATIEELNPAEVWKSFANSKPYAAFTTKTLVGKSENPYVKRRLATLLNGKQPEQGDLFSDADAGAIDQRTMRRFDEACLTPIRPLKPGEIKAIREREHVSQAVFATYLNVTSSLVSKWERGEKKPSGASLKLLSLVEKNGLAAVA